MRAIRSRRPARGAGAAGRGAGGAAGGGRLTARRGIATGVAAVAIGASLALAGCGAPARVPKPKPVARPAPPPVAAPLREPAIAARVAQYGPGARSRLAPYFAAAGVPYPPERFVLLGFKSEREVHLLAAGPGRDLAFIRSYAVHGASGTLGPKLREGDRQVPEGVYEIVYLNPNSIAHLSLALSYPNDHDRARAALDGRETLGGDIMIHGGAMSTGCLAVGDTAAEDLFVLAAETGFDDAVVVLSPVDFRKRDLPYGHRARPAWANELYRQLRAELSRYPTGPATASRAARASSAPPGAQPGAGASAGSR